MFTHLIEEEEEEEECRALCNISLKSSDVEENSKATRQSLQRRCHITVLPKLLYE